MEILKKMKISDALTIVLQIRGVMPKNRQYYRKIKYPDKVTKPKRLVFVRIFLFRSAGSKITYFPTAPIVFKVFISFSSYNKDILKSLRPLPL